MEKIIQRVRRGSGLILVLLLVSICVFDNKKVEHKDEIKESVVTVEPAKEQLKPQEEQKQVVVASRSGNVTKQEVKSEPKQEPKPEVKSYSDEDLYWLSRIVSAEAKGEPVNGQIAVANVVLNRVASEQFPNTIKGVIFQQNQFSPVIDGSIYNQPSQEAVESARLALEGTKIVGEGVVFFYNPQIASSRWLDSRKKAVTIGSHSFTY